MSGAAPSHPEVRIVDPSTGLTKCPTCGRQWFTLQPSKGSRRAAGWWKCPDGCDDAV